MARLNIERQQELEPKRIMFGKQEIEKLGFKCTEHEKHLTFDFNGNTITYFPYSGWHSGKGIKPGRGVHNLLKQLHQNLK